MDITDTLDSILEACQAPLSPSTRVWVRYDTRCYFNVRSKVDISQLNLPYCILETVYLFGQLFWLLLDTRILGNAI